MTRTKEKDTEKRWAKKARWERERWERSEQLHSTPLNHSHQSLQAIVEKNYFWWFFQLNGRNRKRKKKLVKKSIHEIGILRLRAADRPRAIRTFRTNIPEVEVVHWMLLYLQSRQWWGLLKARRRFRPPDGRTWSRRCRLSRLRTFQCFSRQKKFHSTSTRSKLGRVDNDVTVMTSLVLWRSVNCSLFQDPGEWAAVVAQR